MLSPLLDPEKLKDESNLQDKEMYFLLISNFDELKSFLENLNFVNIIECFLFFVIHQINCCLCF